MKLHTVVFICMLAIYGLSCENNDSDLIWVFNSETQCANKWDDIGHKTTEDNVAEYMEINKVHIYDTKIEVYSIGPFCNACTCASGRNIQVLIESKDLRKIEKLGFSNI